MVSPLKQLEQCSEQVSHSYKSLAGFPAPQRKKTFGNCQRAAAVGLGCWWKKTLSRNTEYSTSSPKLRLTRPNAPVNECARPQMNWQLSRLGGTEHLAHDGSLSQLCLVVHSLSFAVNAYGKSNAGARRSIRSCILHRGQQGFGCCKGVTIWKPCHQCASTDDMTTRHALKTHPRLVHRSSNQLPPGRTFPLHGL